MLFGEAGPIAPLTVVDWQTVTWGSAQTDVAYFLGCACRCNFPRPIGHLLRAYHEALGPGSPLSSTTSGMACEDELFGVMMAIVSSMLVGAPTAAIRCHDDARTTTATRHRHRRDGHLAITSGAGPLQPNADDEIFAPTWRRTVVERRVVLRLPIPIRKSDGGSGSGLIPNQGHA